MACAHHKAYVMGTDIDYMLLHAKGKKQYKIAVSFPQGVHSPVDVRSHCVIFTDNIGSPSSISNTTSPLYICLLFE